MIPGASSPSLVNRNLVAHPIPYRYELSASLLVLCSSLAAMRCWHDRSQSQHQGRRPFSDERAGTPAWPRGSRVSAQGRPLGEDLSCPLPSHAPARISSGVLFRGARRGHLRGWRTGRRPCPAGLRRGRGQGRRGHAQTTAGFRALPALAQPARRPAASRVFRGRRVQGPGFVPTTAGVLQVPPTTPRRRAVRHRAAALPGPAVASSGRRGRHPGLSLGWRCLAVPVVVRAAAAAPRGSQGRGTARTTAGLRALPALAEHSGCASAWGGAAIFASCSSIPRARSRAWASSAAWGKALPMLSRA